MREAALGLKALQAWYGACSLAHGDRGVEDTMHYNINIPLFCCQVFHHAMRATVSIDCIVAMEPTPHLPNCPQSLSARCPVIRAHCSLRLTNPDEGNPLSPLQFVSVTQIRRAATYVFQSLPFPPAEAVRYWLRVV